MTEAALETDALEAEIPAADAPPADVAQDVAPDVTDKATKLGWTPKDQFKGDPDKWVDADAFVRRGEELMPLLKAHNRKLERKVAELEGTLKEFGKYHEQSERRAYDRALRDLKAEHAQAVEAGDVGAADDVLDRMSDLKAEAKAPKAEAAPPVNEAFEDWIEDNGWFNTSTAMKAAAIQIAEEIKTDFPDPARQLAEVSKRIKAEFPEKFKPAANPRRAAPGAVEGAPAAGARTSGKTYSDLPADAKAACDDFVKRVPGFTREKYVKGYFE